MILKQLTIENLEEFIELRSEGLTLSPEAFGESLVEYTTKTYEQHKAIFPSTDDNFIIGAFENSKLVGVVGFFQKRAEKMKHKGAIWGMYITPSQRGNGLGKKLLQFAIDQGILIEEILQIELAVISTNIPAKKLYESLDFVSFGVEKRAISVDGVFYDEDHMVKVIK